MRFDFVWMVKAIMQETTEFLGDLATCIDAKLKRDPHNKILGLVCSSKHKKHVTLIRFSFQIVSNSKIDSLGVL